MFRVYECFFVINRNISPPRDPFTAPKEKRKDKGKRRNQDLAVQEGTESDDTTLMSGLNMGGKYSKDHLENAVSGRNDLIWGIPRDFLFYH